METVMDENKYLTFQVAREKYGINILRVKEIIEYENVTPVPLTPRYICGILNLRGQVVPVIDLGARFGYDNSEISKLSCIVILEISYQSNSITLGVLVDSVDQVLELGVDHMEAAPSFGSGIKTDFIDKVANVENQFVILLKLDTVLDLDELSMLEDLVDRGSDIIGEAERHKNEEKATREDGAPADAGGESANGSAGASPPPVKNSEQEPAAKAAAEAGFEAGD